MWDADGGGSLSSVELSKVFVMIGLSQDHRFANKIIHAIKPKQKASDSDEGPEEIEIKINDFITVFKDDAVSDRSIRRINEEIWETEGKEAQSKVDRLKSNIRKALQKRVQEIAEKHAAE